MSAPRANPFGDLSDFSIGPSRQKPVQPELIELVAKENGFPSRQPQSTPPPPAQPTVQARRRRTGRNQQLNIKARAETIKRFYLLADDHGVVLGELLERALDSFERDAEAWDERKKRREAGPGSQ